MERKIQLKYDWKLKVIINHFRRTDEEKELRAVTIDEAYLEADMHKTNLHTKYPEATIEVIPASL